MEAWDAHLWASSDSPLFRRERLVRCSAPPSSTSSSSPSTSDAAPPSTSCCPPNSPAALVSPPPCSASPLPTRPGISAGSTPAVTSTAAGPGDPLCGCESCPRSGADWSRSETICCALVESEAVSRCSMADDAERGPETDRTTSWIEGSRSCCSCRVAGSDSSSSCRAAVPPAHTHPTHSHELQHPAAAMLLRNATPHRHSRHRIRFADTDATQLGKSTAFPLACKHRQDVTQQPTCNLRPTSGLRGPSRFSVGLSPREHCPELLAQRWYRLSLMRPRRIVRRFAERSVIPRGWCRVHCGDILPQLCQRLDVSKPSGHLR
eukprot:2914814-Rhodomonas_salina.4